MPTRARRRLAALLAGLALAGCPVSGGDGAATVDWDLRSGNDIENVDWPDPERSAIGFPHGTDVTIRVTDDHVFEGTVRVEVLQFDGAIDQIALSFPPMTVDDAYQLALSLGEEWEVDTRRIDAWHARRQSDDDPSDTDFTSSQDSRPLAPGGPAAGIEVRNSFNDERPVTVGLTFNWD